MSTTDECLTEQTEAALWGLIKVYDARSWRGTEVFVHAPVHAVVAAVLPIIRKAQADALRDAAREEFQFSPNVHYQGIRVHERLVKRADRIEKGTDHD